LTFLSATFFVEAQGGPLYGSINYAKKEWREFKPTYIAQLIEKLTKKDALLAMLLKNENNSNQPM